ncbi:hypothetical protein [Bradyrhizobium sp. UFLA05-153]
MIARLDDRSFSAQEQTQCPRSCASMGAVKQIRKQAVVAERAAARTADAFVADQMKSLADAFRAQADTMKKNKKKKKK